MDKDVAALYGVLETTAPLCRSTNALVSVSAERIAAIVVDALFELDPHMDNPWDALPWMGAAG